MSFYCQDDTIAAVATPPGAGGLSVIRVSGKRAFEIVGKFFHPKRGRLPAFDSHTVHMGEVRDQKGGPVDEILVSIFKKPHSYTAEDCVEISSHGGILVTKKILALLIEGGARHAEPGEFTRRAFLNGKMDLTQAEAVLDLICAKSAKSLEMAARQLSGSLSRELTALKDGLMRIYAHMEAYLDFPDEQLEIFDDAAFLDRFADICKKVENLIASFRRGALIREGVTVAIAGKPNAGKSSLFNALLERDRALVSEFPGTTRDTLEEAVEIGGMYVKLIDTAGLTPTLGHPLDRMSMERTRQTIRQADLCLFVTDMSSDVDSGDEAVYGALGVGKRTIVVANKSDLDGKIDFLKLEKLTGESDPLKISVFSREGLDQLEKRIAETIGRDCLQGEGEQITRLRHLQALEGALEALRRSEDGFRRRESFEYIIVDLKSAADKLRELIGEVYSEDLLDVIFSEFCIGK
jgi:tRNA modification GTPase